MTQMEKPLEFAGCRIERTDLTCDQVPAVQIGMPLVDLAQVFASHETRHVLVQEGEEFVGIVSIDDLQQAMRSFGDEASAWHHRVVESLIVVRFNDFDRPLRIETPEDQNGEPQNEGGAKPFARIGKQPDSVSSRGMGECVSVTEGTDLIALLTNEDVLLSWNRMEPALARAALDTLTQLPNRAHFERRFREEWQRASRMKTSLGLLIIDVDKFKAINDKHGHLRGDMVLAAVAQCCQRQLRSYDSLARFAGDEFIALTSGCTLESIEQPIRRLQESTQDMNLQFNNQHVAISLSIGAAVINQPSGSDPTPLFEAADQCLFSAKRDGRARAYSTQLNPDGSHTQDARLVDI
jgi:diguanylate cyclase (GGDEF)-like protein